MNQNTFIDYIGRLRTKPEHVRRQIAVGTAVGTTAVIASAWLFFLVSGGSLLINSNGSGQSNGTLATNSAGAAQIQAANEQTKSGFTQLLGAVGFASGTTTKPALTIVDSDAPSTNAAPQADNQSPTGGDQTIIPF